MPINSSSTTYIQAFARVCFEEGLTEDEAAAFYKAAHTQDLLDNDADFREGFVTGVTKFASTHPGAWDIMSPESKSTTVGAGVGTALGALSGIVGARNPLKLLRNTGIGAAAGGLIGRGVQGIRNTMTRMSEPSQSGPYMPSWASPSAAKALAAGTAAPAKTNFPVSALGGYSTDMKVAPVTGGASANPATPYPQQMLQQNRERLDALNKQIQTTTGEQKAIGTGRGSELGFRQVGKRLQDLQNQKSQLLSSVSGQVGDFRAAQGRSTRSIDEYVNHANAGAVDAGKRLDTNEAYLRDHRDSQWYQPSYWWERMNGVEGRAQEANSQLNHYEELKKQLAASRQAVTGPWGGK